jgi:origin recognition complex subunit 3
VGEDLNGKGQRTSGRSVRHLRRWYQSVTAEGDAAGTNNTAGGGGSKAEVRGDENTAVGADADSGKENDESRAPIDAAAAAAPAARALRERTVAVIGAAATLGTSRPGVMNAESIETPERPVTLLPRRPVVVIVEDTESFDNRVLSDLLLALSDAGDTLPVCVLLGVATSASMMHGIIPAAVAARLRVESFSLWSPKAIMTAVQENVLLDPGFVPAPSNAALELLVTRFAEHDFSLSAARRAMHLLALDHFMTRELSSLAMCMTAAMNAAAEATDALAADDVDAADVDAADVDASIARIARLAVKKKAIANAASEKAFEKAKAVADETLTPSSVAWAKKHLTDFQTGECWVHSNANDAVAADSIARTVADGYAGRRRWAVALRCVAAAATTARYARDEAKLSTLLVDASSTRWLEFFPETLPPGAHVDASDKAASKAAANKAASKSANTNAISQGEKLLRLLCARLDTAVGESREHAVTDAEVKSLALTWLELIAEDPELYAEESAFLERTARLCDPATRARESRAMEEKKEKADAVKDVKADADARTAFMSPPAAGHSRRSRRSSVSAAHMATAGSKDAFSTPAPASVQRGKETPAGTTEAATVVVKPADSKRETLVSPGGAVRAAIHARRRGARDVDMERAAAVAGAGKRAHDANEKDKVLHAAERDEVTRAGRINLAPTGSDDACVDGRSRAASFLRRVARAHASRPPASLRGRELFCISDSSVRYLRAKSQAAPRLCLEQALDKPARLLGCACCPKDGGPADTLPDTCGAYTLLQDMGDAANVHEWFREFCETNEPATGVPPDESTKPNKRSRSAGKKPAHGLSLPAPGDDATRMDDGDEMEHDEMDDEKKEKGTFHLDRRRLWELQARFTRAVAEIEFLGVGKPVKRRKVEYMQRTAFPLDKLLGGDD